MQAASHVAYIVLAAAILATSLAQGMQSFVLLFEALRVERKTVPSTPAAHI